MENYNWFYPENITDALELIKTGQAIPHGGGTNLTGKKLKNEQGFLSLDRLSLHYVKKEEGKIKIGAATDYASIAQKVSELSPGHILSKSLSRAATTPLRNRITIGGGLRLAPNWSDLIGPLVALGAEVNLEGAISGVFPVSDYLTQKELKSQTLITEVILPDQEWESWYYREGITQNDHPGFTISILIRREEDTLKNFRIVITGHTKRFKRITKVEEALKGRKINQLELNGIAAGLELKFASAKGMSSDYIRHLAETQLERGLHELLKS